MPTPFDRDLGYLLPFLDKLEAHAASLSGPAGEELRRLIAEERPRWDRIRALLGGGAAQAKPAETAGKPATSRPLGGFTVGSLRKG